MYVHCCALSICQLPNCNLFTQHACLSYGRDTSSELWTPVQFSLLKYNLLQYLFYCFLQTIIFHTIRLTLCYSKPVRLTTSLLSWGKVFGLCCAGSTLAPESLVLRRTTLRRHQPSTCFLTPTSSITLVSYWGKTCCCAHHTFLLGFPTDACCTRITSRWHRTKHCTEENVDHQFVGLKPEKTRS